MINRIKSISNGEETIKEIESFISTNNIDNLDELTAR